MFDYTDLGLSNNLRESNSLAERQKKVTGMAFDAQYEVQSKKLNTSQSAIVNFWSITPVDTATLPVLNVGEWVTLNSKLEGITPFAQSRTFGVPYITVYQGTSAVQANEIYPGQGANIGYADYECRHGFELRLLDNYNSASSLTIVNLAAGAVSVYFEVRWKYNIERAGEAQGV